MKGIYVCVVYFCVYFFVVIGINQNLVQECFKYRIVVYFLRLLYFEYEYY